MKRYGWIVWCLLATGCLSTGTTKPKPQPTPAPIAFFEQSCRDIWQQELFRAIDPDGAKSCLAAFMSGQTGEQVREGVRASQEWKDAHKPKPQVVTPVLHADGKIFRTENGTPWRYKGVSAFKLLDRFARGENIQPFLDAYKGYNTLRVWPYVEGSGWGARGWPTAPSVEVTKKFLSFVGAQGWTVELTLLTDDSPARLAWAKTFVVALGAAPKPTNVLIEIGNEPQTHKDIKTKEVKSAVEAAGFVYTSGDYEEPENVFGDYLAHHSPRDAEWPRKAHDCIDWWSGVGPEKKGPPQRKPCVLDEPLKPGDKPAVADDWRAYGGGASIMGAGATFHCETCKYAELPTPTEAAMAAAMLEGLNAFPADAPLGGYDRVTDQSLRTYIVGGRHMVRVRPTSATPPSSGWTRIGGSNVLWKR